MRKNLFKKKVLTERKLKTICRKALEIEYGFAPKMKAIDIKDSTEDGTFIRFNIKGNTYIFFSIVHINWLGFDDGVEIKKGTITKEDY